mmetsp:Transcript_34856/g.45893  ORF Transcript_34856/g.45893 Transcript_34856/m.45893 type:complete len:95 (+) Transcript_34856:442-726(+)
MDQERRQTAGPNSVSRDRFSTSDAYNMKDCIVGSHAFKEGQNNNLRVQVTAELNAVREFPNSATLRSQKAISTSLKQRNQTIRASERILASLSD